MNPKIGDILERMKTLEKEFEAELEQTRFQRGLERFERISRSESRCAEAAGA